MSKRVEIQELSGPELQSPKRQKKDLLVCFKDHRCLFNDNPEELNRKKRDENAWIGCDECQRAFHRECTDIQSVIGHYICALCTEPKQHEISKQIAVRIRTKIPWDRFKDFVVVVDKWKPWVLGDGDMAPGYPRFKTESHNWFQVARFMESTGTPIVTVTAEPDKNIIRLQGNNCRKKWSTAAEKVGTPRVGPDEDVDSLSLKLPLDLDPVRRSQELAVHFLVQGYRAFLKARGDDVQRREAEEKAVEIHKAALSPLSVMLSELRAKEAASPRTKGPAPQEEKKAEPFYAVEHPLPLPPLVPNDRDFELHKTLGLATLEAKNKALELEERRLEVDRRRLDAQERLWAEQAHAARIAGLAALLPHCPEALPRLRDCLEHYQPHQ